MHVRTGLLRGVALATVLAIPAAGTADQGTSRSQTAAANAARAAAGGGAGPRPDPLQRRTVRPGHRRCPRSAEPSQGLRRAHHRSSRPGALSVHRRPRRFVAGARRTADRGSGGARAPGSDRSRDWPRRDPLFRGSLPGRRRLVRVHARPRPAARTGGARSGARLVGDVGGSPCARAAGRRSGGGLRPADCAHGNGAPPRVCVGGGGVLARRGRLCPWPRGPRVERGDRRLRPGPAGRRPRRGAQTGSRPSGPGIDHPRARPPPSHRRHARSRTGPGGTVERVGIDQGAVGAE